MLSVKASQVKENFEHFCNIACDNDESICIELENGKSIVIMSKEKMFEGIFDV